MAGEGEVRLGDEVQDLLSGVKGIAIGRTSWITGCDHIQIKPQGTTPDGNQRESLAVDEPMVKILKRAKVLPTTQAPTAKRGGPRAPAKRAYGI
jgi:hypothetical protein